MASVVARHDFEQVADGPMGFDRMSQRVLPKDAVAILPPDTFDVDKAAFMEVTDNALDRSLGDANAECDAAKHNVGLVIKNDEHMSVIGEEGPFRVGFRRFTYDVDG